MIMFTVMAYLALAQSFPLLEDEFVLLFKASQSKLSNKPFVIRLIPSHRKGFHRVTNMAPLIDRVSP